MSKLTRRQFTATLAAGTGVLAMPAYARAQGKPKAVVIGGGAGGATAARHIALASQGGIDVTLIEAAQTYTTCFFSNLFLGGFRSFESITHGYDRLVSEYGITKVTGYAAAIDRDKRQVTMADGSAIPYDRLVVSPGIDLIWDSIEGYSEEASEVAPHAWKAGPQTLLLKDKLAAVEDGQQILMIPPPDPYRCPPGPYERASMMAHALKSSGRGNARIIILDPKPSFSKQALFMETWEQIYPGMIEWISPDIHGGILSVDVDSGEAETDFDIFRGDLLNIIPAQRAGAIAIDAGLADDSGFCPVEAASMRSAADENIFVIGDASIAGAMPKSGSSANSQAKVAAQALRGDLTGSDASAASYFNTCWSLIGTDNGVKVGAEYAAEEGEIVSTVSFISEREEDPATRLTTYEESLAWYEGLTTDMFG
jgi:NADPH-dependent 2,4-dienoyl-CoA reductase/sulfur reductase-like enzyme